MRPNFSISPVGGNLVSAFHRSVLRRLRATRTGSWIVMAAVVVLGAALAPASQAGTAEKPAAVSRQVLDLDGKWRFHFGDVAGASGAAFDDASWDAVTVPHTWNNRDGQAGGEYKRGAGWYRRHLVVPAGMANRELFLEFDAASMAAEVWVNGERLGEHDGGFARFRFSATHALHVGTDNVIAVRVSNAPDEHIAPLSADFTFFGGLYRSVRLVAMDHLHLRMLDDGGPGVYLTPLSVSTSKARVSIRADVWNDSGTARTVRVSATISGKGQRSRIITSPVAAVAAGDGVSVTQVADIPRPRLWNGRKDPFEYTVTIRVQDALTGHVADSLVQPLGLRTIRIDPKKGLYLNGSRLAVHGVNRHQDRKDKGWAISAANHRQDFSLITRMGANAVRLAHYQQDPLVYDLTDRLGLLVWTEIPLVDKITDDEAFSENARKQLQELIKQNYNHPSVAFWGIANEIKDESGPDPNKLLASLGGLAHNLDPTRPTTIATCCTGDNDDTTKHTDLVGYNVYFGWYGNQTVNDVPARLDELGEAQPNRGVAISEYGAGASIHHHDSGNVKPQSDGFWHPEEYQSAFHEAYLRAIRNRPFVWGSFVWNMFDFASAIKNEGDAPGINDKGLVTYDRRTFKDAFYLYQANWTSTPVVHINSRRWTCRTQRSTDVTVYSNARSISGKLNGHSLGQPQTLGMGVFRWADVSLSVGRNVLAVKGSAKHRHGSDAVRWTLQKPGSDVCKAGPTPGSTIDG
jgi:beta-galactosidase